jgi:DNA-binding NarL/FixJ family response regulator
VDELLEQGFRKKQIAFRTGLSLNLVRELVNGPEASRFPTVEARREAVQEQIQQGCKLREIVSRLHLSESIVRADIRQLGIDIHAVSDAHEETAERKAAILDMRSKGMSADDIAEEMNMSRWQVNYTLRSINKDNSGS